MMLSYKPVGSGAAGREGKIEEKGGKKEKREKKGKREEKRERKGEEIKRKDVFWV